MGMRGHSRHISGRLEVFAPGVLGLARGARPGCLNLGSGLGETDRCCEHQDCCGGESARGAFERGREFDLRGAEATMPAIFVYLLRSYETLSR
jgi:hypothetical protein